MLNKDYCYSFDGVYYGELYKTEEECKKAALQELLSINTNKEVYIGKASITGFTPEIDIEDVLMRIMDTAEDNEGELAEDYLLDMYYAKEGSENYNLQVELSERLNKVLLDFLKEHNLMPDWYIVKEWELYRLVDGELV